MLTPHPTLANKVGLEKTLSVVVPVFNEAGNINPLLDRLLAVMKDIGLPHEIIFIDDGSKDQTAVRIMERSKTDANIKLIRFSRNFGKEAALNAGLAHATGDAVIQLDADLQHPPEVIADFVQQWHNGGQIVYGARSSRESDPRFRRFLTKSFYRVFSMVSDVQLMEGLGDFLLFDRKVVEAILQLPERERFTKGLYAWVGFERISVPFEVAPRLNGQSGWDTMKLLRFGLNAITSFGTVPLKIWSYVGLILAISAVFFAGLILLERAIYGTDVRGYPSLMAAICFFSGVQLMGLGIVGEYLSRVLAEVKQRPLYLVQEKVGFDEQNDTTGDTQNTKRIAS